MCRKLIVVVSIIAVLGLAGGASAYDTLVVLQGETYTVTGQEVYDNFEVAGTLVIQGNDANLMVGLGTDHPRSRVDGPDAIIIVNSGALCINSRLQAGIANDATIIVNGGLLRVGTADSVDDFGDLKLPDETGGVQRVYLNGGILWVHRCDVKMMDVGVEHNNQIIVAGGEMRVDELAPEDDDWEHYDPCEWKTEGKLVPAENEGYVELVIEPNTPSVDYYRISAIWEPVATSPYPENSANDVCPQNLELSWTPGIYCVADHNIYFGDSMDDVNESADPCVLHWGANSWSPPGPIELGKTYYWRVEEVNDVCNTSPWGGIVWTFTTEDGKARDPAPPDGIRGASSILPLSWTPSCLADSHDVYVGTNSNEVSDANNTNHPNVDYNNVGVPSYDANLATYTQYYWRVDEVNDGNVIVKGDVWSFRSGVGGLLMWYTFDGSLDDDLPSPITDSTGNVTFTKYTDPNGSVKYAGPNPGFNVEGTSADFTPEGGFYRDDTGPNDILRLDGYQYTIEMWMMPDSLDEGDMTLIEKSDGSWWIIVDEDDDAYQIQWRHGGGGGNDLHSDVDILEVGEWTHIAAVFDQLEPGYRRMQLYIDGWSDDPDTESALNPPDNNEPVGIGLSVSKPDPNYSYSDFFDGRIDELRIYDVALGPEDFLLSPGPEYASNPEPRNKQLDVDPCDPNVVLSWTPGIYCVADHNFYFGTNLSDVDENADPCAEHLGPNSWTPPTFAFGTTYYWRVDEVNDACDASPWVGVVWRFTTKYKIDDPNRVVRYKFDETGGDTAFDSSGYGFHGTVDGPSDGWDPNDGDGGCRIFDNDTAVIVPRRAFSDVTGAITIAVWLNGLSTQSDNSDMTVIDGGVIHDELLDGAYSLTVLAPAEDGSVAWRAGNDTNDVLIWEEANPSEWKEEWHHFAFVKDESAGTMTIYFDGLRVDSKTGTISSLTNALGTGAKLGAYTDNDSDYEGKMDDFRIYKIALSAAQIAAIVREDLGIAWGPSPYDGQPDAPPTSKLIWRPGDYASSHEVYFGTNQQQVEDANNSWPVGISVYKGNQGPNTYDPSPLDLGTTYYWRIDEVNDTNDDRWTGKLWMFKVADYLIIDNFDDDTAQDPPTYDWVNGNVLGTGATLSLRSTPPEVIGEHSMRYDYTNFMDWQSGYGYYSETETVSLEPNDWDYYDVKTISLWFYGTVGNDATEDETQMNLGLEDDSNYAVVWYGELAEEEITDVQVEQWQLWEITTTRFTNINFSDVKKICIGFGTRGWPMAAGGGTVYFDEINL
ncbi:MAG: LamG domain-containing protein, partial [Planctomycetota bacterium]